MNFERADLNAAHGVELSFAPEQSCCVRVRPLSFHSAVDGKSGDERELGHLYSGAVPGRSDVNHSIQL